MSYSRPDDLRLTTVVGLFDDPIAFPGTDKLFPVKLLVAIDEFTRECLSIEVGRTFTARDELLNRELFLSLTEARCVLDEWRLEYNHHRPHSRLGWMMPAAFAARCRGRRRPWVPPDSATPHPPEPTGKALV